MAKNKSAKGNPAAKRMQNANLKARRKASWERNQRAKAIRIAEQREREEANKARREATETPVGE